jgi:signal transduction histidine kinase
VDETAHTLDRMLVKLQSISDVGTQQLVYKEVFITELINDILDSFRDEIQHKNMKVSTQINLSDSFYSYPAMVKIVLGNLIENAIQFHSPDNPVMSITVHQEENRVVLKVADNGQGIEAEMKDKIFEMYFRGSDRSKGNGLGLYIAKKAVEKLGGTITVESAVYMGTTFTVTLPMGNSNQM